MQMPHNPILVPYEPSVWEILLCVGIVLAVAAGVALLIILLIRRKRRKKQ